VQDKRRQVLLFDLKNAQIKILSFLTYLLRQFTGIIRPHQARSGPPAHFVLLAPWQSSGRDQPALPLALWPVRDRPA
jgi:hypothetical protein